MTRPTKQTQANRRLLQTILGAIGDTSALEGIDTYELLLSASKLIGRPGDKEIGLLNDILDEVSQRTDLKEVPPALLLSLSVAVINKVGEATGEVSKDEAIAARKKVVDVGRVKRC